MERKIITWLQIVGLSTCFTESYAGSLPLPVLASAHGCLASTHPSRTAGGSKATATTPGMSGQMLQALNDVAGATQAWGSFVEDLFVEEP